MSKPRIKSIGILGGSFDPPPKGHLEISKLAIKKVKLNKLYWVAAKKNPFKKKTLFSLEKRLSKIKKIVKNFKNIEVLYLDSILNSSRSINTIKYLIKSKKPKNLYFIIGSDILVELHKWKSWKKIVKLVKLVVFSRKGYDRKSKETIVVKYLNKKNITFVKNKPISVSSTILRKKIIKNIR